MSISTHCISKFALPGLLALLSLACLPTAAAEEPATTDHQSWRTGAHLNQKPHWTLELKGGDFEPELEEWETFYGDDHTDQLGVALGYKILRQVEVGLAVDMMRDEGVGTLPLNDTLGGEVNFHRYPAHVYVLLRGIWSENQWLIPYIGGGITRVYYRQEIDNQASVRGEADGSHTRAGLQILLDALDEGNAAGFEEESVENTYLVIEAVSLSAEVETDAGNVELGGESLQFGLVFEF